MPSYAPGHLVKGHSILRSHMFFSICVLAKHCLQGINDILKGQRKEFHTFTSLPVHGLIL